MSDSTSDSGSPNHPVSLPSPRFLYGTAWKEQETRRLVTLAIARGFRGIDTANQRRHYYERAVGQAIADCLADQIVTRQDLFLQTKFTFQRGQDHRLPYDPTAPVATQVEQSFRSSLEHLQTESVESLVLHGPSRSRGLAQDDWDAWRAMEAIHARGQTAALGVSNINLDQLRRLCDDAVIRPTFVQNRCFAAQKWDQAVRKFCQSNSIVYQGFSLLTANREVLRSPTLSEIAARHNRSIPQIVFRFALDVGMLPLTGTTNPEHMTTDLAVFDFQLDSLELKAIENAAS